MSITCKTQTQTWQHYISGLDAPPILILALIYFPNLKVLFIKFCVQGHGQILLCLWKVFLGYIYIYILCKEEQYFEMYFTRLRPVTVQAVHGRDILPIDSLTLYMVDIYYL